MTCCLVKSRHVFGASAHDYYIHAARFARARATQLQLHFKLNAARILEAAYVHVQPPTPGRLAL